MAPGPESEADHRCEWRSRAEALETEVSALREANARHEYELEALKRRLLGPKSEKMPAVEKELRGDQKPDWDEVQRRRRERRKAKEELVSITTTHEVAAEKRRCPACGSEKLKKVGEGKECTVYDYIPAKVVAHRHVRETLSCPCGQYVVTADGPEKWREKTQYSASYVAHLVTAKCADSIPLYRIEKENHRLGIPVSRSTMTDQFHASALQLSPIADRILALVRESWLVHADETPEKVQAEGECRIGYIWIFRAWTPDRAPLIAYRFAPSRSGDTPKQVLGGTTGCLVVDGYTGYNSVTDVDGRTRVGCHAHVRRYFFDALSTAPEAQKALDFIRELYRVEHAALEARIIGTATHLELRQQQSASIRNALRAWLEEQKGLQPPKSPFGEAIRYTLNQWERLGEFLKNPRIPLDNNPAESGLRCVALGRKNFLFVGNDKSGDNLAGLYSIVATCEANGVNPEAYLADVLVRVNTHPASRIDELLPHNWRGPPNQAAVAA